MKTRPRRTSNSPRGRRAVAVAAALAALASAPGSSRAEAPAERNFYDVLEDVLGDFEFDLKNGNVSGLKNIAVRNIALSENVPPSFRSHLELLITERVLRNTKTKMLQCLPCKARRTNIDGDQVVITSPQSNPAELLRVAKLAGIEHFIDAAFSYQPSGIVLSLHVTEPDGGSVIWSRSYNSETSRAAAFRRGVDYSQIDDARKVTEYTATVQYRAAVYYLFEPNFGQTTGCLGLGFRMVERYDNRKKEVGFEIDYLKDSSTLAGSATAEAEGAEGNLYSGFNGTLLFVHGWNLIGDEEDFNQVRGNLTLGIGGSYAAGFLGALLRGTYEWRLGKHFAVSGTLGYRPASTAFIGAEGTTISGAEFGLGLHMLF